MLDVMRANTKSMFITLIFGALIVTFILQFGRGSSGFRAPSQESWAAKVNGELVTASDFQQAYTNRFRQQTQMRGGKYTADNAKQDNLKKTVLDALVDKTLVSQQAKTLGLSVSDQELADAIARDPQLQKDGKFDYEYYKLVVENSYNMSLARFEDSWRRDMIHGKVVQAAIAGAETSDDEVKAEYIAENEGASISYVRLNSFMFRDKASATDAEIDAYAKAHEAEIAKRYDDEKAARWTQPAAMKVQLISVNLKPGASSDDEKAARAKIDKALADINGGKDFGEVAKAVSDDSSKDKGGDVGFVAKGQSPFGRTIEEEAAKLKPGQLSAMFKDRTGFHLLKGVEARAAREQPLDEVRKNIAGDLLKVEKAKELAKQKATETLAQLKEGKPLADLFPPSKVPAGQFDFASFTTPHSADTEVFHPTGGFIPGLGQVPALSAAVFATTSAGAMPAAPVEEGDSWYVFKVKSRERADPSKLDEAQKKQLRERLIAQKQGELYQHWIDALRKDAKITQNDALLSYEGNGNRAGENFNPDDY
jgi:peptidyl-prolyl cis-trans isomerase D